MDYNFVLMLTDDFIITRPVPTPDGYGGNTVAYTSIGTVKGRLDEISENDVLFVGQDLARAKYRLFVAPGTNILRNDKVTGLGISMKVLFLATVYEDQPLEVTCEFNNPNSST